MSFRPLLQASALAVLIYSPGAAALTLPAAPPTDLHILLAQGNDAERRLQAAQKALADAQKALAEAQKSGKGVDEAKKRVEAAQKAVGAAAEQVKSAQQNQDKQKQQQQQAKEREQKEQQARKEKELRDKDQQQARKEKEQQLGKEKEQQALKEKELRDRKEKEQQLTKEKEQAGKEKEQQALKEKEQRDRKEKEQLAKQKDQQTGKEKEQQALREKDQLAGKEKEQRDKERLAKEQREKELQAKKEKEQKEVRKDGDRDRNRDRDRDRPGQTPQTGFFTPPNQQGSPPHGNRPSGRNDWPDRRNQDWVQERERRQSRPDEIARVIIDLNQPRTIDGGTRVLRREGDRVVIRGDDNERFRRWRGDFGTDQLPNGRTRQVFTYPDGSQIITIRDRDGDIISRVRRLPNGRTIVLITEHDRRGPRVAINLPPLAIRIPRDRYIVDNRHASSEFIEETLIAPPVEQIERPYSLDEIRFNARIRDKMRRIDVSTITFESGSAEISPDQIVEIERLGQVMRRIIDRHPDEVFLIEGYTDAVGDEVYNLALSDRRAESIAIALTEYFDIPPENLVTQGYGEAYLKVMTEEPERENRRVSVRRVSPLMKAGPDGPGDGPRGPGPRG